MYLFLALVAIAFIFILGMHFKNRINAKSHADTTALKESAHRVLENGKEKIDSAIENVTSKI